MEKSRMMIQNPVIVAILAILCCLLWGSAFPGVKIGYELCHVEGVGSQILFAGWRFFLAGALTLAIFSVIERKIIHPKRRMILPVIGQGLLNTTVQYFFFYIGLAHTTGAKGSIITAANVFFSILFAHFLIKGEPLTKRKVIGCIVGFLGVIVINIGPGEMGSGFSLLGDGFIIICSIAYGASTVTTKIIARDENPETITAYQLMIGGAVLIIMGLIFDGKVTIDSASAAILFAYLCLLSTIAFAIWSFLLKYNPVGLVSPYGFTNPIFATVLSGIFLHEDILSWNNFVALLLICSGIVHVNRPDKESLRKERES